MSAPVRREQILDVTTQLVLERGFHRVSIESVAQGAGVTRALIYQHFRDLQALLAAVVEREMSRAHSQVSETALRELSDGDPRELMLESLRAYLCAVRDHPGTWRLVLMSPRRRTRDPAQEHRPRPRLSARRARQRSPTTEHGGG